jgi:glucan 1,3-beta-glucosidase
MGPTISTEKLHEVSEENVARIQQRRRSRKPLCTMDRQLKDTRSTGANMRIGLIILAIAGVVAAAGITVGVLFATKVIRVGGSSTDLESTASAASDSPTTSSAGAVVAATTSHTSSATSTSSSTSTSASSTPTVIPCSKPDDIPKDVQGTFNDVTSWSDMKDFNCTYTDETVGGLPMVGLNSTWDDSAQANPGVPALNQTWKYGSQPIRGVNLGGWFSLEPFITPTLFGGAVDESTLCKNLGDKAASTLDKHYSTFITEDDFKAMAAAGLDHVRIPYSYWAVTTYDGDTYVKGVSWRYLLRAIEWARRYGIRVNLDLHAAPGSQNGWNHSGQQGKVNWLVGPDGAANAQKTLDLHNQLSQFFAQDRYKNVVTLYGLLNEPAKSIPQAQQADWTAKAAKVVQGNGLKASMIFSEAMMGFGAWAGQLTGYGNGLVIDGHLYTIFDAGLIAMSHAKKVGFACDSFASQVKASEASGGFGPTLVGEWSQADQDCALYLNGVGNGARWNGTFYGDSGYSNPGCPSGDKSCDCPAANADPSTFSDDYKTFLSTFAEAQMSAFENGWGWFYWTWKTESAPLWSYQAGLAGGYMPSNAASRGWSCGSSTPSFGSLSEGI